MVELHWPFSRRDWWPNSVLALGKQNNFLLPRREEEEAGCNYEIPLV
jgi:hypothetical protein